MNVLGIETSCDETGLAIVKNGRKILGQSLASSLRYHKKYGGVIPEIASRMHVEAIGYLFEELLKETNLKCKNINLVAVTNGPGLLGSLLVGVLFGKSVAFALNIPIVGVDHLYAHLYSAFLDKQNSKRIDFPFIGLVVSGGHTSLFYVKNFLDIELLGSTLDDACGEVLDKVARFLDLGYPGGPVIERLAREGNSQAIHFSSIKTDNPLDFSFSGVKTAVLYYLKNKGYIKDKDSCRCPLYLKKNICASLQEVIFSSLAKKAFLACEIKKVKRLVVGGGVAVNRYLREKLISQAKILGVEVYFSPVNLCMDNAVMVAGLGYVLFKEGKKSDFDFKIYTN